MAKLRHEKPMILVVGNPFYRPGRVHHDVIVGGGGEAKKFKAKTCKGKQGKAG